MRRCTVDGCDSAARAAGLCKKHYERRRVHGDPTVNLTGYGLPALDRFMAKVHIDEAGCWLWTRNTDTNGYGVLKVDGKNRKAHRWSYEHHVGPIPDRLDIDHLCRVRNCVNPGHLEPVTTGENQRRGLNGVLKSECRNGHPYTADNVKVNTAGRRVCITCSRAAHARYRAKEKVS